MDDFEYIEKIADFFIQYRVEDINKLKPDSIINISLYENKIFGELLNDKREKFRKILKESVIRAYVKNNLKDTDISEIDKTINQYRKINIIIHITQSVEIEEINAEEHERRIITFPCEIQTISDPKTIPITEIFVCNECGEDTTYNYDPDRRGTPECPACEGRTKNDGIGESETVITVYLKEIIGVGDKNKRKPIRFMADIHGEQVRTVDYNQKVMVTGIFKSIPPNNARNKSKIKSEILIDIITLESMEIDKSGKLESQSLEKFKQHAKDGKLIDMLVNSYAPHIKFGDEGKLACILNLTGGVRQDNYKDRIHIFLCGDPATSKTEIANWMVEITPNSAIVDGTGSTGVGLGAGAIKLPDGTQSMSLGPLVKNDYVVINELDKMKSENYNMLLEAFENGRCSRDIAGMNVSFHTNVSIIATANPVGGKWDLKHPTIAENVNIQPQMLSRFDSMIRFLNIPNKIRDRAITDHIRKWRAGKIIPPFNKDELMCYLNSVRDLVPHMSEETEKYLSDFYVERENYQQDENSINMDQRQYGALVRIAYAFTKLLFKEEVDKECIDITLDFYKRCIESFGLSYEKGGSFSEASNNLMKYTETKDKTFFRLFRELEKEKGDVFKSDLATNMSKEIHWKTYEDAITYINAQHDRSIIIEKSNERLKLVN